MAPAAPLRALAAWSLLLAGASSPSAAVSSGPPPPRDANVPIPATEGRGSATAPRRGRGPFAERGRPRGRRRAEEGGEYGTEFESLATPYDGSNGSFGTMFDVLSAGSMSLPVRIRAVAVHLNTVGDECPVRLYTKEGTHRGFEEDEGAWTLLFDGAIVCSGFQRPSVIAADALSGPDSIAARLEGGTDGPRSALQIGPGQTRAFYVHSDLRTVRYANAMDARDVTAVDGNLIISAGTGMGEFFRYPSTPRHWNGKLYYDVEGGGGDGAMLPNTGTSCSRTLETAFDGTAKTYGSMFNVRVWEAAEGVAVTGIDIHTEATENAAFQVYAKAGTYNDALGSGLHSWTLIASGNVQGAGPLRGTALPSDAQSWFSWVRIDQGESAGFYVTFATPSMLSAETQQYGVMASDGDIGVEVGVGTMGYPLMSDTAVRGPQMWNGRVHYKRLSELDGTCPPAAAPSAEPSAEPNAEPSAEPSNAPGAKPSAGPSSRPTDSPADTASPSATPTSDPAAEPAGVDTASQIAAPTESPTSEPAAVPTAEPVSEEEPTSEPTAASAEEEEEDADPTFLGVKVAYAYYARHPASLSQEELFNRVGARVEDRVGELLRTVEPLRTYAKEYELILAGVTTEPGDEDEVLAEYECQNGSSDNACTLFNTQVTLAHSPLLESRAVRYELLRLRGEVTAAIEYGGLEVEYVGDEALEATVVIAVWGVPPEVMGPSEVEHFQRTARAFLNDRIGDAAADGLAGRGLRVLTVQVVSQQVFGADDDGDDLAGGVPNRNLKPNPGGGGVEATTVVTGEHRPPPPVDFDALVEDSIDRDGEGFAEDLKSGDEPYFEEVTDVSARGLDEEEVRAPGTGPVSSPSIPSSPSDQPDAPPPSQNTAAGVMGQNSGSSARWHGLAALLQAVAVIVECVCCGLGRGI